MEIHLDILSLVREDSLILSRETSIGRFFGGVGVLLLDASVKMEIIDFLSSRTKQEL